MNIDEAISAFSAAGLYTRRMQESPFVLFILGDPQGEILNDDSVALYQWGCFVEERESGWRVAPPPILAPGPGPTCETRSLKDAVELAIDMFRARHKLQADSSKEHYLKTVEALRQWCSDKGYDGNAQ